jgi:GTP cyclohydrolase I
LGIDAKVPAYCSNARRHWNRPVGQFDEEKEEKMTEINDPNARSRRAEICAAADLLSGEGLDEATIERAVAHMLEGFGEDPQREGLVRTPLRVSQAYRELLAGYWVDPYEMFHDALFNGDYDEMVLVRDIEYYSMCEHHLIPFLGRAHVAYIPGKHIIGLSKIPRVVDMFARRLQVQERMTHQITNFLQVLLKPKGVAVVVEGLHMCAMMRGVKKRDARLTTSMMYGVFKEDAASRNEFLDNISRGAQPMRL